MTGNAGDGDDGTAATFHATCSVCEFEREVDGQDDALDTVESHREECGADHFVELYRLDAVERDGE